MAPVSKALPYNSVHTCSIHHHRWTCCAVWPGADARNALRIKGVPWTGTAFVSAPGRLRRMCLSVPTQVDGRTRLRVSVVTDHPFIRNLSLQFFDQEIRRRLVFHVGSVGVHQFAGNDVLLAVLLQSYFSRSLFSTGSIALGSTDDTPGLLAYTTTPVSAFLSVYDRGSPTTDSRVNNAVSIRS